MSLNYEDKVFWPVYITKSNLDAKIHQRQNCPGTLFLKSISIVYKLQEDSNNKNRNFKAKIYY